MIDSDNLYTAAVAWVSGCGHLESAPASRLNPIAEAFTAHITALESRATAAAKQASV